MEFDITGLVVAFLLVVVLVMQIQLSTLSKKIDEREESIDKKIDELLKEKENKNEKHDPKVSNIQF